MRLRDFQRSEESAVNFCPTRNRCPIGSLCGLQDNEGGGRLMPTVVEYQQGDLLWTDLHYDRHVFILREGVLSCRAHLDPEGEAPLAIYGAGSPLGLADLYIGSEDINTYHLHAVVAGSICSLPPSLLKMRLETLDYETRQKMWAWTLYNQGVGTLIQSMISSRPLLVNRVTLLLIGLQTVAERSGKPCETIYLTHEEISQLVLSDRASVSRTLRALEEEGVVSLGYRSIRLTDKLRALNPEWREVCNRFNVIN